MIDPNALRSQADALMKSLTPATLGAEVTLTTEEAEALRGAMLAVPMILQERDTAAHLASEYGGALGEIQDKLRVTRQRERERIVVAGETIETFDRDGYSEALERFAKDTRETSGVGEIASIGLSILLAAV